MTFRYYNATIFPEVNKFARLAWAAEFRLSARKLSQVKTLPVARLFQGVFQPNLANRTIMLAPLAAAMAAIDGNNFVWRPVQ